VTAGTVHRESIGCCLQPWVETAAKVPYSEGMKTAFYWSCRQAFHDSGFWSVSFLEQGVQLLTYAHTPFAVDVVDAGPGTDDRGPLQGLHRASLARISKSSVNEKRGLGEGGQATVKWTKGEAASTNSGLQLELSSLTSVWKGLSASQNAPSSLRLDTERQVGEALLETDQDAQNAITARFSSRPDERKLDGPRYLLQVFRDEVSFAASCRFQMEDD
jgi:hypothetical protein